MVVTRSTFSLFSWNFLLLAIFSLIKIRMPEAESMRLCRASLVIAIECDKRPTMTLKTASRKLVAIKSHPHLTIILLRVFSVISGLFIALF